MTTLQHLPVDAAALTLYTDALANPRDSDGFTLSDLLRFYSGYDPALLVGEEYPEALFTKDDLIRDLIAEIRRLRGAA